MIRYKHREIGTKPNMVEVEFATENGQDDTEVRLSDATLCWIHKDAIDVFAQDLQAVIDKYRTTPE